MRKVRDLVEMQVETPIHPVQPKGREEIGVVEEKKYRTMMVRCDLLTGAAADQAAMLAKQCELIGGAVRKFGAEGDSDPAEVWEQRGELFTELHNKIYAIWEQIYDRLPQQRRGGVR